MVKKQTIYQFILFLFSLSCLRFYNIGIFTNNDMVAKGLNAMLLGIIVFLTLFYSSKVRLDKKVKKVSYLYAIFISSFFISTYMAYYLWNQPLLITFIGIIPFFTYYVYFFLVKKDISIEYLEKMILIFAVGHFIFSLLPFVWPGLFSALERDEIEMRGANRVLSPAISFMRLFLYLSVGKYIIGKDKKWIKWIALGILFTFLSLTRQHIGITILLISYMFLRKASFKLKFLYIIVFAISLIFIIPRVSIVSKLVELTEYQLQKNESRGEDDIRLQTFYFFTSQLQPNMQAHLFGNGFPIINKGSKYGDYINQLKEYGLYAADVGWAGIYAYFGAWGLISLLLILFICLFLKIPDEYFYAKIFLLHVALTGFLNGNLLANNHIIVVVIASYILVKTYTYKVKNK